MEKAAPCYQTLELMIQQLALQPFNVQLRLACLQALRFVWQHNWQQPEDANADPWTRLVRSQLNALTPDLYRMKLGSQFEALRLSHLLECFTHFVLERKKDGTQRIISVTAEQPAALDRKVQLEVLANQLEVWPLDGFCWNLLAAALASEDPVPSVNLVEVVLEVWEPRCNLWFSNIFTSPLPQYFAGADVAVFRAMLLLAAHFPDCREAVRDLLRQLPEVINAEAPPKDVLEKYSPPRPSSELLQQAALCAPLPVPPKVLRRVLLQKLALQGSDGVELTDQPEVDHLLFPRELEDRRPEQGGERLR
ncbi:unnamed protein product [Polarella glacialis]|uniref:Uncharacterized protein n=1 Tax=Polarella glacialis TaxID=89957 RepID=A0A813H370_POLGL|nr:unnamed protein product [Polarella glacialis]